MIHEVARMSCPPVCSDRPWYFLLENRIERAARVSYPNRSGGVIYNALRMTSGGRCAI